VPAEFIHEDFLLDSPEARRLYHEFAAHEPIIDYHTHLPAREIAENRRFANLAEAWLESDHYKWRVMRANGVPESHITGEAGPREKFRAWARTVPKLLGNPLYHWAHLELKRFFGIGTLLNPDTESEIWEATAEQLADLPCRELMRRMNVRVVCTTDDPADSLEFHEAIAADPSSTVRVYPTFRPDAALRVEFPAEFNGWLQQLSAAADVDVDTFGDFWAALNKRHDDFHRVGCRLSDHGIEVFRASAATRDHARLWFDKLRSRDALTGGPAAIYKTSMLGDFARLNAQKGWVQQFHVGPLRNNRIPLIHRIGRDAGADSIGDEPYARAMNAFFGRLDTEGRLAKTIVYNVNPADNAMVLSTLGNFEDGSVPGKMQFGSAWWFNDHIEGMEAHLTLLARMGVLSRFVGMLTDSRSFLSFPRHEYFRRVLCNFLGREISTGRIPNDIDLIGGMVRDICYRNAESYFGFPK
jgi:glucuronate isomerase